MKLIVLATFPSLLGHLLGNYPNKMVLKICCPRVACFMRSDPKQWTMVILYKKTPADQVLHAAEPTWSPR